MLAIKAFYEIPKHFIEKAALTQYADVAANGVANYV